MSKVAPTHRPVTQIRTRLAVVEQLLDARPLTAEGLRASLRAEAQIEIGIATARVYLTELREEGRAIGRRVSGPANRNGTILFFTRRTPKNAVEEAVAAIETRPAEFTVSNDGRPPPVKRGTR